MVNIGGKREIASSPFPQETHLIKCWKNCWHAEVFLAGSKDFVAKFGVVIVAKYFNEPNSKISIMGRFLRCLKASSISFLPTFRKTFIVFTRLNCFSFMHLAMLMLRRFSCCSSHPSAIVFSQKQTVILNLTLKQFL